ncbi:hypothetical protein PLEOSDRAFT_162405 [Pleurotus ostreatus PC15]|uniref:Uncharacterized protein n=1 Tax=Pleurotus ostreatus (strain PC15) TaxID=1137138 RepID=A0A067N9D2_PLEO1|nr:hypothetical protein PLEOSDRAFT_162405 [Pleurotus ostreatus PC15]
MYMAGARFARGFQPSFYHTAVATVGRKATTSAHDCATLYSPIPTLSYHEYHRKT